MVRYQIDQKDFEVWINKNPEYKKQYEESLKSKKKKVTNGKNGYICYPERVKVRQRLRMRYMKEHAPKEWGRYKTGTNKHSRKRNRLLKIELVNMLGGECEKCRFKKHFSALEFHHKNPKDKWSKTTFSGYLEDPERFKRDIKAEKISLLCANCHKILHYGAKKEKRIRLGGIE